MLCGAQAGRSLVLRHPQCRMSRFRSAEQIPGIQNRARGFRHTRTQDCSQVCLRMPGSVRNVPCPDLSVVMSDSVPPCYRQRESGWLRLIFLYFCKCDCYFLADLWRSFARDGIDQDLPGG